MKQYYKSDRFEHVGKEIEKPRLIMKISQQNTENREAKQRLYKEYTQKKNQTEQKTRFSFPKTAYVGTEQP